MDIHIKDFETSSNYFNVKHLIQEAKRLTQQACLYAPLSNSPVGDEIAKIESELSKLRFLD